MGIKNKTFYKISIKIKIFCDWNNIRIEFFADIMFDMFWVKRNRKKYYIFSEMKILQCIEKDVIVNLNDIIRIVHCALNIESAQLVSILTFEYTSN